MSEVIDTGHCLLLHGLSKGVDASREYQEDATQILDESLIEGSDRAGSNGVVTEHACIERGCEFAGFVLRQELGSNRFLTFVTDNIDFGANLCGAENPSTDVLQG